MLRVSCKDVRGDGCDFVAEGKKDRQIRSQMIEHLREAHPETVAGIDYDQLEVLQARIKSSTRSA
jgi:predicted small metal-binding protein